MSGKSDKKYDFIIIGSGVGGLSAATYLSNEGYSVLVLERHFRPGGYASNFKRKGCIFDSAVKIVSGIGGKGLLSMLLEEMGIEGLDVVELDNIYRAVYPEHTIEVKSGVQGLIDAYSKVFPEEHDNIINLVSEMEKIYYCTMDLIKSDDPLNMISNSFVEKYGSISYQEFLEKFTKNEYLVYTMQALAGYLGVSTEEGSAMYFAYSIITFFIEGAYYIRGSFQKLVDKLIEKIEKNNAKVLLGKEVTKVNVENNKVTGVVCSDGQIYECDNVISDCDYRRLIYNLIGEEKFSSRYIKRQSKVDISMSMFEVYIITDLEVEKISTFHEGFVYDYYNFSKIYNIHKELKNKEEDIKGIALSCPTLVDKSLTNGKYHTVVLSTILPYHAEEDWHNAKERYAQKMIKLAERALPGLSEHIIYVESASPKTMERYTLNSLGSSYGWEQNKEKEQYIPKLKTPIKGLYIVGHWTVPGGGVASVTLSAYKLIRKLRKDKVITCNK